MNPTFAHFPIAYPDETVHSLCSRLATRARLYPEKHTLKRLFGEKYIGSYVDLPLHIDKLHANFVAPQYTIEQLIFDHTLAPFYGVFWLPERFNQLLFHMGLPTASRPAENDKEQRLTASLDMMDRRIMYCPECAREQQERYDTVYWTRLHQARGVEVCPIHHLFLHRSRIVYGGNFVKPDRNAILRGFHNPADHIIATRPNMKLTSVEPNNPYHQILLDYATDVQWLLQQRFTTGQQQNVAKRLIVVLARKGYGLHGFPHVIRPALDQTAARLRQEMDEHFSDKILSRLGVPLFNTGFMRETNWVNTVIPNHYLLITPHPMKHWLLIRFLGYSMEEFWKVSETGCEWHDPYPCLEAGCPNFWVDGTYSEPCKYGSTGDIES